MTTRQTVAGAQGAENAITRAEAIALHTVDAARLLGESGTRGACAPARWRTSPSGPPTRWTARRRSSRR
ncbi:hypothetical protein ACFQ0M_08450 [Kitasatospora aburaviensis]